MLINPSLISSITVLQDSETVKGSKRGDDKSMEKCKKSLRANRTGVTANSTSANNEVVSRQSVSRRTSGMNTTKHVPKSIGEVFTFKSDEKAEKRKEYNMKLGEKLLAKEAKMSEMQAKSHVYKLIFLECFPSNLLHMDLVYIWPELLFPWGYQFCCSKNWYWFWSPDFMQLRYVQKWHKAAKKRHKTGQSTGHSPFITPGASPSASPAHPMHQFRTATSTTATATTSSAPRGEQR